MRPKPPNRWCAVYTRKSSEEGLEQQFNSLDAQREAGTAYVKSQQHEGWRLLTTQYDDGGYSGGTLDRPALQHLLADIRAGKVQILRPGMSLERGWRGVTHNVTVLADGFVYRGQRYRSLSQIARLITGTRWNGPAFFGLRQFNGKASAGSDDAT